MTGMFLGGKDPQTATTEVFGAGSFIFIYILFIPKCVGVKQEMQVITQQQQQLVSREAMCAFCMVDGWQPEQCSLSLLYAAGVRSVQGLWLLAWTSLAPLTQWAVWGSLRK